MIFSMSKRVGQDSPIHFYALTVIRKNRTLYGNSASPFHLVSIKYRKIHVLFDAAEAASHFAFPTSCRAFFSRKPLSWVLEE